MLISACVSGELCVSHMKCTVWIFCLIVATTCFKIRLNIFCSFSISCWLCVIYVNFVLNNLKANKRIAWIDCDVAMCCCCSCWFFLKIYFNHFTGIFHGVAYISYRIGCHAVIIFAICFNGISLFRLRRQFVANKTKINHENVFFFTLTQLLYYIWFA